MMQPTKLLPAVDIRGKALAREEWCDVRGHCWHVSQAVHTIEYHRDDICCHCGEERCVSLFEFSRGNHGNKAFGAQVAP